MTNNRIPMMIPSHSQNITKRSTFSWGLDGRALGTLIHLSSPQCGGSPPTRTAKGGIVAQRVENPLAMQEEQEMWVQFLYQEDRLEEEVATNSSILVWNVPWTKKPGRLQSKGLQRVGHD